MLKSHYHGQLVNDDYINMAVHTMLTFRFWTIVVVAYFALLVLYNLYFHSLAKYPGPFWARTTLLWRFWHSMSGHPHRAIEDCHRKYGDVFRVGPNELSFATVQAFKDIYTARNPVIPKSEFYDMLGSGFSEADIACERDHKTAVQKRALFSTALSVKALTEQEVVIQRSIDAFIEKLGKLGCTERGLDLTKWYMMLSFDIAGEMAFGESFGCIASETSNAWLDTIFSHLHTVTFMDNIRRFPLVLRLARLIPTRWTTTLRNKVTGFAREKTTRRLEKSGDRRDFLSNVVDKVRSGKVSEEEMAAHCSIIAFVIPDNALSLESWMTANTISLHSIAGSETSATSMATITYFLLKSPTAYTKLTTEIRSRFKSLSEIDISSTSASQLPYLHAVMEEGMRIVPTASLGFSRNAPGPGVTVDGHFVPAGTELYVSAWTVARDERYFRDATTFKPERWIDPDNQDVKDASQPFWLGPRSCPGKNFAYAQMGLTLAKMVWAYDMELIDQNLNWERDVRVHFVLWKPELRVRSGERAAAL
ncbi:hypothetical protein OHC33_006573 [Knufia fluminis]|uniref:Cytochrome P450 n=1 Tax=Knufia fluminis TaxID=191047 RepID=A0AAN8EUQ5_9EURO|nr:hypothetical protein OHC33_006573 [Knufia fluminis]